MHEEKNKKSRAPEYIEKFVVNIPTGEVEDVDNPLEKKTLWLWPLAASAGEQRVILRRFILRGTAQEVVRKAT